MCNKGDVVNLSLGAYCVDCTTESIQTAGLIQEIAKLEIFVVIAAGNDDGETIKAFPACVQGPAGFEKFVRTVGAVDNGGICTRYSNFGPEVELVEAGTNVLSTYYKQSRNGKWQYCLMTGTSMSAAVVSGVIHATRGGYVTAPTMCAEGLPVGNYQIAKTH